ncbi:cytochrome P450 4C1-like [Euwallacea similis]|uniref:cytochrome P450 4C1-like n=1 Tax=Euwallacea similis TaxID=1736056 RepID=UPI00344FF372
MSWWWYFVEILIILSIELVKYLWTQSEDKKCNLEDQFPGPKAYPVIGNLLTLIGKDADVFENIITCVSNYSSPMRFLFGSKLCIIFRDPRQIEKIFTSNALSSKDDLYDHFKDFLGEALVSGSGTKWKKDRRLLSPFFLKRNTAQYFPVVLRHTKILTTLLEQRAEGVAFNVRPIIHKAVIDFVNETILGKTTNAQAGEYCDFVERAGNVFEIIHQRTIKLCLLPKFFFNLTKSYVDYTDTKDILHAFFWKALKEAKERHSHLGKNGSIRSTLEQMLDIRDEVPDFATDEELVHHVLTLFLASEDTVTQVSSFALMMLGMHPDYEEKVAEEIVRVVGLENDVTAEHLPKLEQLEKVVKETLRLFPVVPFILRKAGQDIDLAGLKIPEGTSVLVAVYNIHRDQNHWEHPNEFYPEHFSPEAVKNRNAYAYLPFSAGVRSCLGKIYAYMAIKILLVSILQKYVVSTENVRLQDMPVTSDFSVRLRSGNYAIRLKRRLID